MENKQRPKKIKKIVINGKEYVDLEGIKTEIGMTGALMLLEGRLITANAYSALLHMLERDEIFDSYPKTDNSLSEDTNIVNLFGDNNNE